MKNVLVTGATGFVGRHLVPHLVRRGDRVRCLIRPGAGERGLAALAPWGAVERVVGDVTDPASLEAAVAGAEVVYHLAGATIVSDVRQYALVNDRGTAHLAAACARVGAGGPGPPVVVYLSSLAAAGPSPPADPRDEATPAAPVSEYGRSKLAGEQRLRALADRLPCTVLRPPGVLGPGDRNNLPLFRTARFGITAVPGAGDHRLCWIDIDDLLRALTLAADRGRRLSPPGPRADPAGGVYFVAMDETPTAAEAAQLAGRAVGVSRVRVVGVPPTACRVAGAVVDALSRLTGRPLMLRSDKLREGLAGSWLCRTDRARADLDFRCAIDLPTAFARAVASYRHHGWLPARA